MFKEKIKLLILFAKNTWHIQTAHYVELISELGSTAFYMLTLLLFIKILYANVKTFAGYTQNEMMLLVFVGQLFVYTDLTWSIYNLRGMIENVRTGSLDLLLTKPISSLFYVTFQELNFLDWLVAGFPNLIVVSLLIDWNSLNFDALRLLTGIIIFICGQISWHCFRFLFALSVFFIGQSDQLFLLSGAVSDTNNIPYEGFTGKLRLMFTAFIPTLITAQLPVSVVLGKSDAILMLGVSLLVTVIFLLLKHFGWIIALRNYSSASS